MTDPIAITPRVPPSALAWAASPAADILADAFFGQAPALHGLLVRLASGWASKPLKHWDGSAWTLPTLRKFDGTAWVPSPATFAATSFDTSYASAADFTFSSGNRTVLGDSLFQKFCASLNPLPGTSAVCIYWEATCLQIDAAGYHTHAALIDVTASPTEYTAGYGPWVRNDGYANRDDGTGSVDIGMPFGVGDVLKFCMKNGKLYVGTVAGGWNGGGNPDAETSPFATLTGDSYAPGVGVLLGSGEKSQFAFNFGQSAWAGTPPTGATGWPAP